MMSTGFIAFIFAMGSALWIYNFFMKQTGGLAKTAATMALGVGVIVFIVSLLVMSFIL